MRETWGPNSFQSAQWFQGYPVPLSWCWREKLVSQSKLLEAAPGRMGFGAGEPRLSGMRGEGGSTGF